jgi:hypothetical protein
LREEGHDGHPPRPRRARTEAGEQVQIGGNETYVSLCRRHWREATPNFFEEICKNLRDSA